MRAILFALFKVRYCFASFFPFVAIVSICLLSCISKLFLPSTNPILGQLLGESKERYEEYVELNQLLNDDEKIALERAISGFKDTNSLGLFIKDRLRVERKYQLLQGLLLPSERSRLKEEAQTIALQKREQWIDQQLIALGIVHNTDAIDEYTQKIYMSLLEILPEVSAKTLKERVTHAASPEDITAVVESILPESLKQLDKGAREKFIKLHNKQSVKILTTAMQQTRETSADSQIPPLPKEDTQSDTTTTIEGLIGAQYQLQQDHPDDEWGTKLPLQGVPRTHFFKRIMQFSRSDQQILKQLFQQAEEESISSFLAVYDRNEFFSEKDRMDLLAIFIALYRYDASLCLTLCNDPESLSFSQKMTIAFKLPEKYQVNLLKRLMYCLE